MNPLWPRISVYLLLVIMLFSIVVVGCAGMKPYEPRNNREEGPEKGLFSGSQGEFEIYRGAGSTQKQKNQDSSNTTTEGNESTLP